MSRPLMNMSSIVAVLVVAACALRFVALEVSPPGFYVDEAAIAAQVVCLADSGHDLSDRAWPLFTPVLGGGYATPPMLYLGAAWAKIFGSSISSLRGFSAFFGVLFVFGSYLFSLRIWRSRDAAWLSALCAALSPWAFQFSRIAWDPAVAPAFLALAFACFFTLGPNASRWAALGGLMASAAAYSYPPLRVQLLLVVPASILISRFIDPKRFRARALSFLAPLVVTLLPLIILTVRGDIQRRFRVLSVFNENYLRQFGEPTIFAGLWEFTENFASHFSPDYLLLRGDLNPRHSTGVVGQWSSLEILAVAVMIVIAIRFIKGQVRERRRPGRGADLFAFAIFGYVAGIVPAALTWESNPHALRSIGALVFLALGAGGALSLVWRQGRSWQVAIVVVAVGFALIHQTDYFFKYPRRVALYFNATGVRKLQTFKESGVLTDEAAHATPELRDYPTMALRYFQMRDGVVTCK